MIYDKKILFDKKTKRIEIIKMYENNLIVW